MMMAQPLVANRMARRSARVRIASAVDAVAHLRRAVHGHGSSGGWRRGPSSRILASMPDPASIPTRPLNAYKVLGVAPDADHLGIQAAYRTLAKQFHPDRNGSAIGRRLMLVVNEAYDAVKTPERRAAYDAALRRQRLDHRPMPIEEQRPQPVTPTRAAPAPSPTHVAVEDLGPLHRRARSLHATEHPAGARVLEFGRYAGHTIEQVARIDRDWLEWFIRTPLGRPFTREVLAALG